jgi:hypothetical protein
MLFEADVVIVHDCAAEYPPAYDMNAACCSVCNSTDVVWRKTHTWLEEPHGLHLVLKKEKG